MVNQEKVRKAIGDTTKLLLEQGLSGEEYLLTLQTLIAHVLSANDVKVKKIFLMNLNLDVRARRIAKLQVQNG